MCGGFDFKALIYLFEYFLLVEVSLFLFIEPRCTNLCLISMHFTVLFLKDDKICYSWLEYIVYRQDLRRLKQKKYIGNSVQ